MTYADFYISVVLDLMMRRAPKILDPYPNALAITQKVREIPSIKHWIETSPQTPF